MVTKVAIGTHKATIYCLVEQSLSMRQARGIYGRFFPVLSPHPPIAILVPEPSGPGRFVAIYRYIHFRLYTYYVNYISQW